MGVFILLGLFTIGCGTTGQPHTGQPQPPVAGKSIVKKTNIRLKGFRRAYRLHIPAVFAPDEPLPLLIVLHGAFSTAERMEQETGFSQLADREKFLVAYPNGMGIFGLLQHWNAGHCCGRAKKDRVDDVGFLDEMIKDIQRYVMVDDHRIYVAGFSNGGMLAYRFAAERSQTVAAAATLAASIGGRHEDDGEIWQIPAPKNAVPLLIMHGTADPSVPYAGGESTQHGGRFYLSVKESAAFWQKQNRCQPSPEKQSLRQDRVLVTRWKGSGPRQALVLYTLKDWGHQWPGRYFTEKLPVSHPLYAFDGTRRIWEFLKSYSLP
jgi:polyhydroxybutyrate depolymerase